MLCSFPGMNNHSLRRRAALLVQSMDWLVLAALLVTSTPPILIRRQSLTMVPTVNLVDGSWLLDTCYKAATGVWFGRDVAFTYGPLYQWLSSAVARCIGISTGAIYATWSTVPFVVIIGATFATARLLLPEAAAWKRAIFVVLAVYFWSPPDVRVSVNLLAFAIFVLLADIVVAGTGAVLLPGLAAALICLLCFLLSADTGIYCLAAFLLCVAATAVTRQEVRRLAKFSAITVASLAVLVLLTNTVMLSPLDFQFWRSSLIIAGDYRWFVAVPMIAVGGRALLATVAMGAIVFGVAWWQRKSDGPRTSRPAFLLAGFCLALLMLQTSVVRSDALHVVTGIYPMIFLCCAIALGGRNWPLLVAAAVFLAGAFITLSVRGEEYRMFVPPSITDEWRHVSQPVLACPEEYQEFDRACFPRRYAELFSTVSAYVDQQAAPADPILVFPYQTAFGLMSRRKVAGGVLQSYVVNGSYLTDLEVSGLQKAKPPFGLYFPDGILSTAIDSVPNFTRSPEVWFYLFRHYRDGGSFVPGITALIRDETRDRQIAMQEETVATPPGEFRIADRIAAIQIGNVRWPAAGADFLKLRIRVNYPPWWRLRKPSALILKIVLADGSEKALLFVAQPNQTTEIWVYPWEETQLAHYFSSDQSQWRPDQRPAPVGLTFATAPFDRISVTPKSVVIEAIDAVRVSFK